MVFSVTTSWLLINATASLFSLNGSDPTSGYLEYNKTPITVSSTSALLERTVLEQICSKLGFRAYPLFKLSVRNLPRNSSWYGVDGCVYGCYDIYLECQEFPFRLDQAGNIRVWFKDTASALCAHITAQDAMTLCKKFHQTSTFRGQMEIWNLNGSCPNWFEFGSSCEAITPVVSNACGEKDLAAIRCQRTGLVKRYRLKSWGRGGIRGTLEIRDENDWSPVCSDMFSLTDAAVACRTLGYPSSDANYNKRKLRSGRAGGTGRFNCQGDEKSLDDCPGFIHDNSKCISYDTVEISCQNAYEGKLRLTGGYDGVLGRLEVFYNNTWGTICDNSFGEAELSTACSQITEGRVRRGRHIFYDEVLPPSTVDDILLDAVDCWFRPDLLVDCDHKPWGNHSCTANNIVRLSCSEEPRFRLVGGDDTSGRLEVYHDNQWGTICGRHFGENEARAACKTLNFSSVVVQVFLRKSTNGTRRIWLDDLSCGSEVERLNDCVGWHWGKIDYRCSGYTDVHLSCPSPDRKKIHFSLAASGAAEAGVVRLKDEWEDGDICMASPSKDTAVVACRTLGLPTDHVTLLAESQFRKDFISYAVMNGVRCRGHEANLLDCSFLSLKSSPCDAANKLVVACGRSLGPDYSVRLVGSDHQNVGRLEVLRYGVWGTVCNTGVDIKTLKVACRELGLPTSPVRRLNATKYRRGAAMIWLDKIQCHGHEDRLELCDKSETGKWCLGHERDLAIQCGKLQVTSNGGAIAGGVIGGLLLLVIITTIVCWLAKRRNSSPLPPVQRPSQPFGTYGEMPPSRPSREQDSFSQPPPDYQDINMTTVPISSTASTYPLPSDKTAPPPSYDELFGHSHPCVQEHTM
ncbi:scavenger receptor cysteine-rich type 1 protein M160-like isoform X2 [Liolophura sinensis]|uniref:scavenger receptor cysteine-rich type 1 protein M160-like isoform X2 n=1 Tax=Liolophura sinensis TaxID=3198878 RepID=UPI00315875C5